MGNSRTLRKPLLAAVVGVALLLASIVLLSGYYHRQVTDARHWVRHTREVIEASHILLSQMLDLETRQRAYLLTFDETHLGSYADALNRLTADVRALQGLVADNPSQERSVVALGEVIERRLAELNRTLAFAKQGRHVAALENVRAGSGRELMDEVRVRIAGLIETEKHLLDMREQELGRVELLVVILASVGTTVAVALLIAALGLSIRETSRRRQWLAKEVGLRKQAQAAGRRAARAEADATRARGRAETAYQDREQFLVSGAHDLRQPLHLIRMALLAIDDAEPDKHAAMLRPIRTALRMLDRTLEQFIDARRLTMDVWSPAPEPLALRDLFRAMKDAYGPVAARAGLAFRCRPLDVWVMTDRGMTERILSNLLLNAIKYTEKGGLLFAARRRGKSVLIQVWDTGIGISRAEFEQIFREFGRAGEHDKEGLGLGLFVSGKIARALGSELAVASKLGSGSCFSFSLPVTQAPVLEPDVDISEIEQAAADSLAPCRRPDHGDERSDSAMVPSKTLAKPRSASPP